MADSVALLYDACYLFDDDYELLAAYICDKYKRDIRFAAKYIEIFENQYGLLKYFERIFEEILNGNYKEIAEYKSRCSKEIKGEIDKARCFNTQTLFIEFP